MKKLLFTILCLSVFISCSKDDSDTTDENGGNPTSTNENGIKSIEYSDDNGVSFTKTTFDSNNRPEKEFSTSGDLYTQTFFVGSDYSPQKREYYSSTGTVFSEDTYEYNSNNELIKFQRSSSGFVTFERTFEHQSNGDIVLKNAALPDTYDLMIFDSENRPYRMETYTVENGTDEQTALITFEYDNSGNMVELVRLSPEQNYTSTYTYDNKPNPFLNQFGNKNVNYLLESIFDLEDRITKLYSPNNYLTDSGKLTTRNIEYNEEGNPETITIEVNYNDEGENDPDLIFEAIEIITY